MPLSFRFLGIVMTRAQEHPGSVCVVYSGHAELKNIVKVMQLGASDFISKGEVPPHELVAYIEHLFDEQQRAWERHKELEILASDNSVEWQTKYAGQHIVLVGNGVVAAAPNRLEALLNYDDLRVAHPDWPEMPDFIEVVRNM
jgi:YesN/AraC family two-component response regulator